MPRYQPTSQRNLDGYGAPQIDWARVAEVLDATLTQIPNTGGPNRHTPWYVYRVARPRQCSPSAPQSRRAPRGSTSRPTHERRHESRLSSPFTARQRRPSVGLRQAAWYAVRQVKDGAHHLRPRAGGGAATLVLSSARRPRGSPPRR